jgi:hypothetical protein
MSATRHGRRALLLAACLAASVLGLAVRGAPARASLQQESTFQDDKLLVYGTPAQQAHALDVIRSLGADRVRVSVFWSIVAPAAQSTARPRFDATDPGAYGPTAFSRYDTLLELAAARGIAVNFDITSPAPYWATGRPPRGDIQKNWQPSPSEFGQFVTALGRRYSGTYVPARAAPFVPAGKPLPRVSYWSIWNEPNQPGWLTPQYSGTAAHPVPVAPVIYRNLLDAAYAALVATGHAPQSAGGSDTLLIGETAPKGDATARLRPCSAAQTAEICTAAIKPVDFVRTLYCVGTSGQPLSGAAATAVGCPAAFSAPAFVQAHPALFNATGYAHHPYELTFAPTQVPSDPAFITIANLPTLTALLAQIMSDYGFKRPLGLPLYLTEFGYLTDPPSPLGLSFAAQSAYMNEAEFTTYNNPNVATLSQFLLVDDLPKPGVRNPLLAYGGTFQTGLELANGRHKPSFEAYRLPIDVPFPHTSRGHGMRVWGMVRAARRFGANRVAIQWQARTGSHRRWRTLKAVGLASGVRYLDVHVRPPGTGWLRLAWVPPRSRRAVYSRLVPVRVR